MPVFKMNKKVRFNSTKNVKHYDLSPVERESKRSCALTIRIIEKLRKLTDYCIYLHEHRQISKSYKLKIRSKIYKQATQFIKNLDRKLGPNWRSGFSGGSFPSILKKLAMDNNFNTTEETRELILYISKELAFCGQLKVCDFVVA